MRVVCQIIVQIKVTLVKSSGRCVVAANFLQRNILSPHFPRPSTASGTIGNQIDVLAEYY